MNKVTDSRIVKQILVLFFLSIGVFLRFYLFGSIPGGVNQDEAFVGYEAYSLLNYGTDTAGYQKPVYLVAWGSGTTILNSWLMMPFIKLFGLSVVQIRLPQAILGCISLFFIFFLTKRIYGYGGGLAALALLAVSPWHIMMSRWGLECNLAPAFLLAALYFFIRGVENNRFFLLSAFSYGISLYSYATLWTAVPILLFFEFLYLIISKKLRFNRYTVVSFLILCILALPLIIFVLINLGYLNEIKTSWISIPKLLWFRKGDVSFHEWGNKWKILLSMIIKQTDNNSWNFVRGFGFLGYPTLVLSCIGLVFLIRDIIREQLTYDPKVILLINFAVPFFFGTMIKSNVNRINILWIPMIILAAVGIISLKKPLFYFGISVFLSFYSFSFAKTYFVEKRYSFGDGLEQALQLADARGGKIYLSSDIIYPRVLFYEKIPVDLFRQSVIYKEYPAKNLKPVSFLNYSYDLQIDTPDDKGSYVVNKKTDLSAFKRNDFTIIRCEDYYVIYK